MNRTSIFTSLSSSSLPTFWSSLFDNSFLLLFPFCVMLSEGSGTSINLSLVISVLSLVWGRMPFGCFPFIFSSVRQLPLPTCNLLFGSASSSSSSWHINSGLVLFDATSALPYWNKRKYELGKNYTIVSIIIS